MSRPFFSKIVPFFKNRFVARCEAQEEDDDDNTLLKQAVTLEDLTKLKIKTPVQFENLKNDLTQTQVNSYDGFRTIVQKQTSLNAQVVHFFWMGAQGMQSPMYKYRLVIPYADGNGLINTASDTDCNIECDIKHPISEGIDVKVGFQMNEQMPFAGKFDLERVDESSATQFSYSTNDNAVSVSHMQAITPQITLGGLASYAVKDKSVSKSFAGSFVSATGENNVTAQYDYDASKFHAIYLRKVNPNRVHVATDLAIEGGNSQMTLSAEYFLKTSKLHFSVDSNAVLKTSMDVNVQEGFTLQLAAEMQQATGTYKFGTGIIIG